jgi:hypothetical protein
MKRIGILFLALPLLFILACGSSPAPAPASASAPSYDPNLPEWFDDLMPEDELWAIGSARLQNDNLARQAAASRARRELATMISVQAQSMLTDYAREAGTLNNSTSLQLVENVGRDLVNQNLSGAVPNKQTRTPDGTWWVRVALKKADANKLVNNVVENDASRYADFKAQEALKMLDANLDKLSGKPASIRSVD